MRICLCLGHPNLFRNTQYLNETRLGVGSLVKAAPIPLGHLSGLTTWLSAQAPPLLTPEGFTLLPACCHQMSQLLPQLSPLATAQEARDWELT